MAIRDMVASFPADSKLFTRDKYIGLLHRFVKGFGRHAISEKDADQRRKQFLDGRSDHYWDFIPIQENGLSMNTAITPSMFFWGSFPTQLITSCGMGLNICRPLEPTVAIDRTLLGMRGKPLCRQSNFSAPHFILCDMPQEGRP